ncbi:cytochrome P450 [Obba rivulosa]|uniref:Cytochrome P450 n=1 Tax=Obba rivulosa TaxID=1052685 RepID=A0A8E2DED2_9APHY|nr:cytochrome P450 [Obba rivulosa]
MAVRHCSQLFTIINATLTVSFTGATETVGMTVLTCMMVMALNLDKQRLAQEEIDRVVGGDRMPNISDRADLPYVDAVIKETMRWQPALPLGFPRATTRDDDYNGYHIPKSTYVFANTWYISREHNEKYDPDEFIPEQFLNPDEPVRDPWSYAFGFGRRVCPGRYLAEDTVFILIVTILAMFKLEPLAEGELTPKFTLTIIWSVIISIPVIFTDPRISYPKPFKCRIIPRSEAKARLILSKSMSAI